MENNDKSSKLKQTRKMVLTIRRFHPLNHGVERDVSQLIKR